MYNHWRTVEEVDTQAKDLGAITKVVNRVKIPAWNCSEGHHYRLQPWSDHYFNQDRLEIAYCIRDLLVAGHDLHILSQPRIWDDYFLSLDTNIFVNLSPAPAAAGGNK